jgi:hypothetical protein
MVLAVVGDATHDDQLSGEPLEVGHVGRVLG